MRFVDTELPGVVIVEMDLQADERGFYARSWCASEFGARGLNPALAQCGISHNRARGTVRGMHWQDRPWEEAKLVRCTRGAIFDVALDVRRGSITFGQWVARELTADNRRALYIPEGCAHGFQTLADDCEVLYQISVPHHPECARGVRWNDPAFGIQWPLAVSVISPRDAAFEDYAA
jgi:dTDP-4-dehydrorhamnose 3,5-epimerase